MHISVKHISVKSSLHRVVDNVLKNHPSKYKQDRFKNKTEPFYQPSIHPCEELQTTTNSSFHQFICHLSTPSRTCFEANQNLILNVTRLLNLDPYSSVTFLQEYTFLLLLTHSKKKEALCNKPQTVRCYKVNILHTLVDKPACLGFSICQSQPK